MKNRYTGCQSPIYPSLLLCFCLTNAGFRYTIFLTEVGQTTVLEFVTILNLRLSGIVILLPFTDLQDRRRSHRTLLFFGPHIRQAQSPRTSLLVGVIRCGTHLAPYNSYIGKTKRQYPDCTPVDWSESNVFLTITRKRDISIALGV